jgi:hypothetical protein
MNELKVVPHPDPAKRMYKTKEDQMDERGRVLLNDKGEVLRPRGTDMFRYLVIGKPEALEAFKVGYAQYYREETEGEYAGQPFMNSQEMFDEPRNILFRFDGTPFIEEDMDDVERRQLLKKAAKFGKEVTSNMAQEITNDLMASLRTKRARRSSAISADDLVKREPATPAAPQATDPKVGNKLNDLDNEGGSTHDDDEPLIPETSGSNIEREGP